MRFVYFNDTGREVLIHPATKIHGTECQMEPIQPLEQRIFTLPEGTSPWIKMWDLKEIGLSMLVSPIIFNEDDNDETSL